MKNINVSKKSNIKKFDIFEKETVVKACKDLFDKEKKGTLTVIGSSPVLVTTNMICSLAEYLAKGILANNTSERILIVSYDDMFTDFMLMNFNVESFQKLQKKIGGQFTLLHKMNILSSDYMLDRFDIIFIDTYLDELRHTNMKNPKHKKPSFYLKKLMQSAKEKNSIIIMFDKFNLNMNKQKRIIPDLNDFNNSKHLQKYADNIYGISAHRMEDDLLLQSHKMFKLK